MFSTVSFWYQNRRIKQKVIIAIFALIYFLTESSDQKFTKPFQLKTIRYNPDMKVDFDDQKILATCGMTVVNKNPRMSVIIGWEGINDNSK